MLECGLFREEPMREPESTEPRKQMGVVEKTALEGGRVGGGAVQRAETQKFWISTLR